MNETPEIVLWIATSIWLACWAVVFVRRRWRMAFAAASAGLAVLVFVIGPPERGTVVASVSSAPARAEGNCADVKAGMSGEGVEEMLGEATAVVSEEDTFGPGAEAWVYAGNACVVRLIDGRVRSVDFETLQ